jgi:hypothetical protein
VQPASRPRSRLWVAIGVVVVVGCALAFAVAATHLGSRQPVLVVTRAVPAGAVIRDGDLSVVRISTDAALRPVAASQRTSIMGRTAAVPLAAGTLLTASELGPPVGLGAGQAAVGVALKSGQYPPGLGQGETVRVVDVGAPTSTGAGTTSAGVTVVDSATVTSVSQPGVDGAATTVVGLEVPDVQADRVAALAAAGRIALVGVPPRP